MSIYRNIMGKKTIIMNSKKCRIDKEVHRAVISRVSKHDMATVPVEDNEIRI